MWHKSFHFASIVCNGSLQSNAYWFIAMMQQLKQRSGLFFFVVERRICLCRDWRFYSDWRPCVYLPRKMCGLILPFFKDVRDLWIFFFSNLAAWYCLLRRGRVGLRTATFIHIFIYPRNKRVPLIWKDYWFLLCFFLFSTAEKLCIIK